jgi:hypothetical protein
MGLIGWCFPCELQEPLGLLCVWTRVAKQLRLGQFSRSWCWGDWFRLWQYLAENVNVAEFNHEFIHWLMHMSRRADIHHNPTCEFQLQVCILFSLCLWVSITFMPGCITFTLMVLLRSTTLLKCAVQDGTRLFQASCRRCPYWRQLWKRFVHKALRSKWRLQVCHCSWLLREYAPSVWSVHQARFITSKFVSITCHYLLIPTVLFRF